MGGDAAAVALGRLADPGGHRVARHRPGGDVRRGDRHRHADGVAAGEAERRYRANRVARGLADPGHVVLEGVLVVSAGITLAVFVIWFFFLAGARSGPDRDPDLRRPGGAPRSMRREQPPRRRGRRDVPRAVARHVRRLLGSASPGGPAGLC